MSKADDNQLDPYSQIVNDYTEGQSFTLQILGISASVASIVFGLVALYLYACMRTRSFRHHLILLLLMSDFLKALVLLWFPARLVTTASARQNKNFCAIVGFFTATSIELSDLAVLALAVHFALLVFKKDHSSKEGGLYPYRRYVYGICAVVPLLLASLAFVKNGRNSYLPYVTWCYLPVRSVWYRIVLSWALRYAIFITIMALYIAIYVHVKLEYRAVVRSLGRSHSTFEFEDEKNPFKRWWMQFKRRVVSIISYFPGFAFLSTDVYAGLQKHHNGELTPDQEQQLRELQQSMTNPNYEEQDVSPAVLQARHNSQVQVIQEFQRDTVFRFQARRSMIERQIKSIFIYPAAYVFLWAAPFVLQCLQFNYEFSHGPEGIFWINAIAAFMQPFNCVVDSLAFFYRERPWRYHKERVFTTKYIKRLWYKIRGKEIEIEKQTSPTTSEHGSEDHWASATLAGSTGSVRKPVVRINTGDEKAVVVDPFSTTARRVDIETGDSDDDEGEMDLLEFLK